MLDFSTCYGSSIHLSMTFGSNFLWVWFSLICDRIRSEVGGSGGGTWAFLHGHGSFQCTIRWSVLELSPSFRGGWRGKGITLLCTRECVYSLFHPLISKSSSQAISTESITVWHLLLTPQWSSSPFLLHLPVPLAPEAMHHPAMLVTPSILL